MMKNYWTPLPHRSILTVRGDDRRSFLHSLLTQDILTLTPGASTYGLLLTPQGRFLHDMIVVDRDDDILLECETERRQDLIKRLSLYTLRAQASIHDTAADWSVGAIWREDSRDTGLPQLFPSGFVIPDPRLKNLGYRAYVPASISVDSMLSRDFENRPWEDYDRWRIRWAIPDGSRDMRPEKAFPMDYGLDRLNAIAWNKGCYVGQELTARMKYRDLIRKKLIVVTGTPPLPAFDTPLTLNGEAVGTMGSSQGDMGLVLIQMDALKDPSALLMADDIHLRVVTSH